MPEKVAAQLQAEAERVRKLVEGLSPPVPETGWRTWLQLIGSVASIVALPLASVRLAWIGDQAWPIIMVVWLLVTVTHLAIRSVRFREEYAHRSRYALASEPLHRVEHAIRDAEWLVIGEKASNTVVLEAVQEALGHAARAFTVITAAPCRVCIKSVAAPTDAPSEDGLEKLLVKTLRRDLFTGAMVSRHEPYVVARSTAFEALVVKEERQFNWWYSNDLWELRSYKNPSIPEGGSARDLMYRSTGVWPIRKRASGDAEQHDLLGFLCVDAPIADVFVEQFDFHVGAGIADSFYALLKLMRQVEGGAVVDGAVGDGAVGPGTIAMTELGGSEVGTAPSE